MKERPILFSGEMVRAILDGHKTQTRRVMQRQPGQNNRLEIKAALRGQKTKRWVLINISDPDLLHHCPYGQPGDRLWVRETFALEFGAITEDHPSDWTLVYRAGGDDVGVPGHVPDETCTKMFDGYVNYWRPSIHMPRWASRITLEVKDVRVERVQDISEEDAMAEGCRGVSFGSGPNGEEGILPSCQFEKLWDSINAKRGYGWDINPWVWVVKFERERE